MTAYYNEWCPDKAAVLRELIRAGVIAPGDVDDRSITDVQPNDLDGYDQCHFFAGFGIWSYALRLAEWPDDRPVWTGSPPCQPFSAAGLQRGYDDERHLAPAWLALVRQRRPERLFGEQVAAAIRHGWLDDLQDHLEVDGYAVGSATFPACSVGAPHIRQRLYFGAVGLADADDGQRRGLAVGGAGHERDGAATGREQGDRGAAERGGAGGVADAGRATVQHQLVAGDNAGATRPPQGEARQLERSGSGHRDRGAAGDARPTDGFWRDADWLWCRDAKWRPVEPGTFPLVDGAPARVLRLRGYGDGIVAPQAAAFIEAFDAAARDLRLTALSTLATDMELFR